MKCRQQGSSSTHASLFAVLAIVGVFVTLCATDSVATESVTVNAATPTFGPADTRYTGFLAVVPSAIGPERFEALKPSITRAGYFENYQRIVQLGGTFQYNLSPSYHSQPNPSIPGGADDLTYARWDALVDANIEAAKAVGATTNQVQWDIWNEPDSEWPDQSPTGVQQFFEVWRRTFNKVRAELPDVKIAGPSLAQPSLRPTRGAINLNNFLDYCKNNACMPDIVTIHAWDKNQPGRYAQWLNNKFASLNLTNPPAIAANEMINKPDQFRPGMIPQYFAGLHEAGFQYGIHSCWVESDGQSNSAMLDGLLDPSGNPRSTWWVYKKYSEMTGQYVSLTGSGSVTGLASVDAPNHRLMVLLGRDATDAAAIDLQLQIDQLADELGFTGMVQADLWRIENSDVTPLTSLMLSSSVIPLTSESLYLTLPDFGPSDAYYITLQPVPEPRSTVLFLLGAFAMMAYFRR